MSYSPITIVETVPRTIAAVHARVVFGTIPQVFAQYLDQVYAAGKAGAVQLDGLNTLLYRPVPGTNFLDVDFGVGVRAPFEPTGNVVPTVLPAGPAAYTRLRGSYMGIRGAHDAVLAWIAANGRKRAGPSWESYGHWDDDESKLTCDIYWLLEP